MAFSPQGREAFRRMPEALQRLSRRGPDAEGIFEEADICLGHTRLSIIDLSDAAAQPMSDVSGRYRISFNGEFYNYRPVRRDLENRGYRFRTESDTEVLLSLYAAYGQQMMDYVNGFFAFAVYDRETREVLIARDRMGIKPLYYHQDEHRLIFASEMKALAALGAPNELDKFSLEAYFTLGYIPAPHSIYRDVKKLEPGHFLRISKRQVEKACYYSIPEVTPGHYCTDDYATATRHIYRLVNEAVHLRMVSDVPLGAFLSGGLDSSVVAAAAVKAERKLHTFSIGYKDQPYFDETYYANLVAKHLGTEHTVFYLSNDDLFGNLHKVLDYTDEPFADSSALAVNILSMHTRQQVTVALSGDGGDEIFGGYRKHKAEYLLRQGGWKASAVRTALPLLHLLPQSRSGKWSDRVRKARKWGQGLSLSPQERYLQWASMQDRNEVQQLLLPSYRHAHTAADYAPWTRSVQRLPDMNGVLYADMQLVLPNDMLYKVDMMSMENSLEVRVPLLDYRLVDYAFSLPPEYKLDGQRQKKILADAFIRELPAELFSRPKQGFEVPMLQWLRTGLQPLLGELTSKEYITAQNIFAFPQVERLKQRLFSRNPGDVHFGLWSLLVFQYWWKNNREP